MWGSNSRPPDYETDALPTELTKRHKLLLFAFFFWLWTRIKLITSWSSLNMPSQLAWEDFTRGELNPRGVLTGKLKSHYTNGGNFDPPIRRAFCILLWVQDCCNIVSMEEVLQQGKSSKSVPCFKMSVEWWVHQKIISWVMIWFSQHVTCAVQGCSSSSSITKWIDCLQWV